MRNGCPAELVLGSVQLGLAYGAANRAGKPDWAAALSLVRRAADAGIATFDTARAYGDAEDRVDETLHGRKNRTITKLAPLADLAPDAKETAVREAVDAGIAESLAALRVSSLDCVLLHRAVHMHSHNGTIWKRLGEHACEGRLRALGVSVQSPEEAQVALIEPLVRHIQLPFNLLDWRWQRAGIPKVLAQRKDVSVHARSVFLQVLLTAGMPYLWPHIEGACSPSLVMWLEDCLRDFGRVSEADLALTYVRGQDRFDGVGVGMETEGQLETNLKLCMHPPLAPADCAAIDTPRPFVPAALLDPAQWLPKDRA